MSFMLSLPQETLEGTSRSYLCKSTFTLGVIVGSDCVAATFWAEPSASLLSTVLGTQRILQ